MREMRGARTVRRDEVPAKLEREAAVRNLPREVIANMRIAAAHSYCASAGRVLRIGPPAYEICQQVRDFCFLIDLRPRVFCHFK
jgi:hypothetical protein